MERWGLWMEKWSNYTQKASAEDPWTWVEHLPWRREANGEWISISDFILFTVFFLCRLIEGSIVSGGWRLRRWVKQPPLLPVRSQGERRVLINTLGATNTLPLAPLFLLFFPFSSALPSICRRLPAKKLHVHECLFFNPLRGSGTTWPAPNMQRPT